MDPLIDDGAVDEWGTEEVWAVDDSIVRRDYGCASGEPLRGSYRRPLGLGLTAYRVAKEIGVTAPRVHEIVQGKRAITADTALRLGVFFGLPAQFWLNLQNDYDLRRAATDALGKIRPFKAA